MKSSSRTLIAAAVAALIAGGAVASDQYGKDKSTTAGASFDSLDANRDGRISQAEASADSTIMFSSADANGDGYLDQKEFKKAMKGGHGSDSSMPAPQQPQSGPAPDSTGRPETSTPDQSSPPPADTQTPRQ